jgi:alpha-amylase/alpha-mannosidase (GH57 family)
MLNVAFFWHMHQPYYRDPASGEYTLPWVRLHAVKGYYDMISILKDFPAIRQNFNLVPSLLLQLREYEGGKARDVFLDHSRRKAEELTPDEKKFLLANFFMCNWETMVKPYPGYFALLAKRGFKVPEYRWDEILAPFNPQDYRDLQVWFNLTWCGHRARETKEVVRELLRKGRMFSEEDKNALLDTHQEIVREVIPLYRDLRRNGQAELTVSPFYHPILPLLINSEHARRSMPNASLPTCFAHPEDAAVQVRNAVAFFEKTFGGKPAGMWPSEGSVSPELIPLVQKAGISWMASDEGVLFRSLSGGFGRSHLYQAYRVCFQGAEAAMVFRDHNLSDLVGFTYAKNPPEPAARDLVGHLENIRKSLPDDERRIVLIALDGENPWEAFPDGGREFLRRLYDLLSSHPAIRTVRVEDFLTRFPPQETLNHLHTGSWIDQNFRIWIGSPEENHAWDCLRRTRDFLENAVSADPGLAPETKEAAWEEIYSAEGSDWFWWFGDDFMSDNDEEFDRLFRSHLGQVHRLLGAPVPDYLVKPIAVPHEVKPTIEPIGLIAPILDGQITHFYEWREAGYFAARPMGGSMHQAEGFLKGLHYGFNLENLYFRIDPIVQTRNHLEGVQFVIHLLAPTEFQIRFPVHPSAGEMGIFHLSRAGSSSASPPRVLFSIGQGAIIELSVPFRDISCRPKEKLDFVLRVQKGDLEIERYPRSGYLSLIVPDRDYEQAVWQV